MSETAHTIHSFMWEKENLSQDVITKYQAFMKCFRELKKKKISKIIWQDNGKKILGFETDII